MNILEMRIQLKVKVHALICTLLYLHMMQLLLRVTPLPFGELWMFAFVFEVTLVAKYGLFKVLRAR